MEKFGSLDISEKAFAVLRDRWWPQTANEEGNTISRKFFMSYM